MVVVVVVVVVVIVVVVVAVGGGVVVGVVVVVAAAADSLGLSKHVSNPQKKVCLHVAVTATNVSPSPASVRPQTPPPH